MPRVVFVAPFFADTTLRFLHAMAGERGVTCALVSRQRAEELPQEVRRSLAAYERVEDPFDVERLAAAVRGAAGKLGGVDRLVGILEQLQVELAQVRQRLGIPGMGVEVARNFREKARMKTVLRQAGIPCARHRLAHDNQEATAFAAEVGFPLVFKPPAGAGARSTFRVDDEAAFRQGLAMARPTVESPVLIEEFITGREYSFDCVFVRREPRWHSFSRYYPTPLEVLENPWIQWCVVLPRAIDDPLYQKVARIGTAALEALGLETGLAHMEWFERPDGSVAISEVGARPPGAQITSMLSYAHEFDIYRAWARLMAFEDFRPPQRRWAVATVYLRGQGRGRVQAVHGIAEAQRELGSLVVEAKLPRQGQSPGTGYEGEGYVILRHPETAVVTEAVRRLMQLVRVEMG
jgi:biotin carboxylase